MTTANAELDDVIARADALEESGDVAAALRVFDESMEALRQYPKYWARRGFLLHSLGRYEEAIRDFDEAIRLKPTPSSTIYMRARAKQELGRTVEAIIDYLAAAGSDPSKPDAPLAVAMALVREGDLAVAERFLQRATALNMDDNEREFAEYIRNEIEVARKHSS